MLGFQKNFDKSDIIKYCNLGVVLFGCVNGYSDGELWFDVKSQIRLELFKILEFSCKVWCIKDGLFILIFWENSCLQVM